MYTGDGKRRTNVIPQCGRLKKDRREDSKAIVPKSDWWLSRAASYLFEQNLVCYVAKRKAERYANQTIRKNVVRINTVGLENRQVENFNPQPNKRTWNYQLGPTWEEVTNLFPCVIVECQRRGIEWKSTSYSQWINETREAIPNGWDTSFHVPLKRLSPNSISQICKNKTDFSKILGYRGHSLWGNPFSE